MPVGYQDDTAAASPTTPATRPQPR